MEPNEPTSPRRRPPACARPTWRCGLAALLLPAALAADPSALTLEPGSYALESQMIMPHLEEMRRIKSHEERCLTGGEPAALFPVLRQPSFIGCELGFEFRRNERFDYVLVCQSPRVATGTARIERAGNGLVGTLDVKMGGKNMTFTQRVEATRLGPCDALQEVRADAPAP